MKIIHLLCMLLLAGYTRLHAQDYQTLFDNKIKMTGSWAGFSFTPTQLADDYQTQFGLHTQLEYNNAFLVEWHWRTTMGQADYAHNSHIFSIGFGLNNYKVIHPKIKVGLGPGKISYGDLEEKRLIFQPALGLEFNFERWARIGVEGGYRNMLGDPVGSLVNRDELSGLFATVSFSFGWSWGLID